MAMAMAMTMSLCLAVSPVNKENVCPHQRIAKEAVKRSATALDVVDDTATAALVSMAAAESGSVGEGSKSLQRSDGEDAAAVASTAAGRRHPGRPWVGATGRKVARRSWDRAGLPPSCFISRLGELLVLSS